jgi:hypothetical protein
MCCLKSPWVPRGGKVSHRAMRGQRLETRSRPFFRLGYTVRSARPKSSRVGCAAGERPRPYGYSLTSRNSMTALRSRRAVAARSVGNKSAEVEQRALPETELHKDALRCAVALARVGGSIPRLATIQLRRRGFSLLCERQILMSVGQNRLALRHPALLMRTLTGTPLRIVW